jgi:hypothetical protein
MIHMDTNLMPKMPKKNYCEYCDFECSKQSNFIKHTTTSKHIKRYNKIQQDKNTIQQDTNIIQQDILISKKYKCDCGKAFFYHSGLWRHKKTCIDNEYIEIEKIVSANNEPTDKELMMLLIKENSEMKKMMMEIIKNGTHNTNSHNKTFNLQFFLNEQCKDAINITDFVNSIQLQLEDLEETGRLGYVDGISRVVIKNLDDMNVHKRPIHCSDSKREILYIKDNNQWVKENENKDTMIKIIKQVANKNIKNISEWVKAHPDCLNSESKQNDKYLKIVSNSMSGSTKEEQQNNINKIISKVAKRVIINK